MSSTHYVFILGKHDPVILHPFDVPDTFGAEGGGSIMGRYGTGEMPSGSDHIRSELYVAMEKGARRYFLEKGYYLRFALSVVAFVVVYLVLSIFVRDPVPLIDELLVATLSAAVVFFASERKVLASPHHVDAVLSLRRAIDGAYFTESRIVDLMEAWRDEILELGPAAFYKAESSRPVLSAEEQEEAAALCSALAFRWKAKPIVSELYEAAVRGGVSGATLDKAMRRLGREECALALAYLRLIPLAAQEAS